MNELSIKEVRQKLGISQRELAKLVDVHWRTIQNWEKGGDIPYSIYKKLCALMNTDSTTITINEHKLTENERLAKVIKLLIDSKSVRNQQEFVELTGSNKADISMYKNGKKKVANVLFARIAKAFPFVSLEWLEKGSGEMLLPTEEQTVGDVCKTNDVAVFDMVRLIPIYAQAGTLNDFEASLKETDCEKIVSPIKGAEYAITISGESMAPEYPAGSIVLVKRINEKAFIDWGKVYVLDTCNGMVVKILTPSDKDGFIKCVSINPAPIYAPFEVDKNDVFRVYKVLLCMSLK